MCFTRKRQLSLKTEHVKVWRVRLNFPLNSPVLPCQTNSWADIPGPCFCWARGQPSKHSQGHAQNVQHAQHENIISPGIRGILHHLLLCLVEVNGLTEDPQFGEMLSRWGGMKILLTHQRLERGYVSMPPGIYEEAAETITTTSSYMKKSQRCDGDEPSGSLFMFKPLFVRNPSVPQISAGPLTWVKSNVPTGINWLFDTSSLQLFAQLIWTRFLLSQQPNLQ